MEPMNRQNGQEQEPQKIEPRRSPAAVMASLSLVFGIAGMIFCLSPLVQLPLGIAAITLSFLARQNGVHSVKTVLGMVFGIIAIILSLIIFGSIVYIYRVVLNDPVLGPIYNDMYQQIMEYWGQLSA